MNEQNLWKILFWLSIASAVLQAIVAVWLIGHKCFGWPL